MNTELRQGLPQDGGPVLQAVALSRSFGAVQALSGVSLTVMRGQVTALVGDNGAGKSTLVKIICGAEQPDSGSIFLDGRPVQFADPAAARNAGIEAVYQDLALCNDLDSGMNLFMGREHVRHLAGVIRVLDRKRMYWDAETALKDLRIHIPSLRLPVTILSGGQRQAVAVARGVYWAKRVIVLDEPTAALGVKETEAVLQVIERIRAIGNLGIVLVSHSLPEVFRLADRIVVLRHGRKVADVSAKATNMEQVVAFMTGVEAR